MAAMRWYTEFMDLSAVLQKQKERFLRSSADRALKSLIKQYSKYAREGYPREVAEEDMALVQHALNKGARIHEGLGAIDDLIMAPRLMHHLMEYGAKPSVRYLDRLEMWRENAFIFSHFHNPKKVTPCNAREWMHAAVLKAVSIAPELDWQRLPTKNGSRHANEPLANQLDYPFSELSEHLREVRLNQNLPIGPLNETSGYYSILLGELMLKFPKSKWIEKERGRRAEMMDHLLNQGADPNMRVKLNSYDEQDRSLLAQTFLTDYRLVPRLLAAGAIVNQAVINEVAFVLHDRHDPIWAREEDYRDTLLSVLHQARAPILWNSPVPSYDYYQPTLRYILGTIFPDIERDIGFMNAQACVEEIAQATPDVARINGASRRL